jgi:hypothetical protein
VRRWRTTVRGHGRGRTPTDELPATYKRGVAAPRGTQWVRNRAIRAARSVGIDVVVPLELLVELGYEPTLEVDHRRPGGTGRVTTAAARQQPQQRDQVRQAKQHEPASSRSHRRRWKEAVCDRAEIEATLPKLPPIKADALFGRHSVPGRIAAPQVHGLHAPERNEQQANGNLEPEEADAVNQHQ